MYRINTIAARRRRSKLVPQSIALLALALLFGTSVAYAALISQRATLAGNTIQTATAALRLSSDGTTFSESLPGYSFGALIPGGMPMPRSGYPIYVRNVGNTNLAMKLNITSQIANPDNIDLTKVELVLTPANGGAAQNISLQSLVDAANNNGVAITAVSTLPINITQEFTLQIQLDSDALNGPGATLSNIDLSFGGVAVS